jgi:nucleoid-associated protein YgaU
MERSAQSSSYRSRLARAAGTGSLLALLILSGFAVGTPSQAQNLQATADSMALQKKQAERHGFEFFGTPEDVYAAVEQGLLTSVESNEHFILKEVSFPFTRPEVKSFVELLAEKYHEACGEELVVTSLTRPKNRQPRNASKQSVHQAGMAIDIRRSWNRNCRRWMADMLLTLEVNGVLDAMLEWHPQHFHVALFPSQYRQRGSEILESGERTHYQVTRGDTLWKIAKSHNTDVLAVKEMNGLRSSRIYEGQILRLPASGRR